jgi:hypothetical protein
MSRILSAEIRKGLGMLVVRRTRSTLASPLTSPPKIKQSPAIRRIRELEERNRDLEGQLEALQAELEEKRREGLFFALHKTMLIGRSGETIVANAVHGQQTSYASIFDVEKNGVKIEVKRSGLNYTGCSSGRWTWYKIFGESGKKHYDYLVLIGQKENRWRSFYRDEVSMFAYFCVPWKEITSIASQKGMIQISSNPNDARKYYCGRLFADFQTRYRDLETRVF